MSEGWAAIVYGRTYHLDFRLITVPHNFTPEDSNWASQHIVATTQQARNLAGSPRWSLFRNARFCIVGVTTTVKDLIGHTAKDDRGRPLYIFVGYAAQLSPQQKKFDLPAYSPSLSNFELLYQEIKPVWLVKNYDTQSRQPRTSQYSPLTFHNPELPNFHYAPTLNFYARQPLKTYVWPNFEHQNKLLWHIASQTLEPTSICLNIKGKALVNSPFLNLSSEQVERFKIIERVGDRHQSPPPQFTNSLGLPSDSSLSQKISERAKNDLDLTLQQATKMAVASQELINHLTDSNQSIEKQQEQAIEEPEFGFKKKRSSKDCDWF
ncbi:MAG: hypothetical protein AAFO95_04750 [Cyanobacteria bacterium J06600_6]